MGLLVGNSKWKYELVKRFAPMRQFGFDFNFNFDLIPILSQEPMHGMTQW